MALPLPPSRQRNLTFFNTLMGVASQQPGPYVRKIDLVDGRRERPMRVLCLGYSRTGTFSLYTALKMLGYRPYHMVEALRNADVDLECWRGAVEGKLLGGGQGKEEGKGKGERWGREEFDKLMGRCDAVMDLPCILFVEELIAAYPDAKVILTERPVQGWLKSMGNSVGVVFSWWRWKYVAWADPDLAGPLYRLVGVTLTKHAFSNGDYSENSKLGQRYLEHNELVRKVCPPERLLEFKLGSGWEPLCDFLGAEVPDVPYPNINDKEMFVGVHKAIMDRATVFAVQKVMTLVVPVAVLAGAGWLWQRFGT